METIINLSRDKIEVYAKRYYMPSDIVIREIPKEPGGKYLILLPSVIADEKIFQIQELCKKSEVRLVISDGRLLEGKENTESFLNLMLKRNESQRIREQEKDKIILSTPPKGIMIEPTYLCNLKCPHCSTGSRRLKRDIAKLDTENIRKLLESSREGTSFVTLPKEGEPFLFPEITFEIVKMAKNNFLDVHVATNGHYFTQEIVEEILESGINSITVTLDGMTEESYRKYRIGGSLSKVKEGLHRLAAKKGELGALVPHIRIQMILMKHNICEIPMLKQFAKEMGADSYGYKTMALLDFDQKEDWLPQDFSMRRARYHFDQETDYQQKYDSEYRCYEPWTMMYVASDGKLIGCANDWMSTHFSGSLYESTDVMKQWNSPRYQEHRKNLLKGINQDPMCSGCCKEDFDKSHLKFPED